MQIDGLNITSVKILEDKDGWYVRVIGWLPTPCYSVTWKLDSKQDTDYRILIQTGNKIENMCIQIIKEANLDISLPKKSAGLHNVYLNDQLVGTITSK